MWLERQLTSIRDSNLFFLKYMVQIKLAERSDNNLEHTYILQKQLRISNFVQMPFTPHIPIFKPREARIAL